MPRLSPILFYVPLTLALPEPEPPPNGRQPDPDLPRIEMIPPKVEAWLDDMISWDNRTDSEKFSEMPYFDIVKLDVSVSDFYDSLLNWEIDFTARTLKDLFSTNSLVKNTILDQEIHAKATVIQEMMESILLDSSELSTVLIPKVMAAYNRQVLWKIACRLLRQTTIIATKALATLEAASTNSLDDYMDQDDLENEASSQTMFERAKYLNKRTTSMEQLPFPGAFKLISENNFIKQLTTNQNQIGNQILQELQDDTDLGTNLERIERLENSTVYILKCLNCNYTWIELLSLGTGVATATCIPTLCILTLCCNYKRKRDIANLVKTVKKLERSSANMILKSLSKAKQRGHQTNSATTPLNQISLSRRQ